MAFRKLSPDGKSTVEGTVAAALAHGLGLMVGVSLSKSISKGHVNPAVTFGHFVGGDKDVSLLKLIGYWVSQLLGSTIACLLLKLATHGMEIKAFSLTKDVTRAGPGPKLVKQSLWESFSLMIFKASKNHFLSSIQKLNPLDLSPDQFRFVLPNVKAAQDITVWTALVLEIVMTFGVVYSVYATAIAIAIAIGFIVGVNILAGGPFDGAAMNPAIAFGPSLVSWTWARHWVYWIRPRIGAALAGSTFEAFMTRPSL